MPNPRDKTARKELSISRQRAAIISHSVFMEQRGMLAEDKALKALIRKWCTEHKARAAERAPDARKNLAINETNNEATAESGASIQLPAKTKSSVKCFMCLAIQSDSVVFTKCTAKSCRHRACTKSKCIMAQQTHQAAYLETQRQSCLT